MSASSSNAWTVSFEITVSAPSGKLSRTVRNDSKMDMGKISTFKTRTPYRPFEKVREARGEARAIRPSPLRDDGLLGGHDTAEAHRVVAERRRRIRMPTRREDAGVRRRAPAPAEHGGVGGSRRDHASGGIVEIRLPDSLRGVPRRRRRTYLNAVERRFSRSESREFRPAVRRVGMRVVVPLPYVSGEVVDDGAVRERPCPAVVEIRGDGVRDRIGSEPLERIVRRSGSVSSAHVSRTGRVA